MSDEPKPCARCGHAPAKHGVDGVRITCFFCWYHGIKGMNHAYVAPKEVEL